MALQQTENFLQRVFSNIPILIAYLDKDFNFILVNHAYANWSGRTTEFYIGKNYFELFPNEEHEAIFNRVVKTGESYSAFEMPFVFAAHPERGTSYFDCSLQPLKENNGTVDSLVLTLIDVNERRLAAESARAEFAFCKAMEESIISGVAAFDLSGRQIYVNPAFCTMVGWSAEELLGAKPPFIYWPPEERETLSKIFRRIIGGQKFPEGQESRFQRKSGERFDVLLFTSSLKDSLGKPIGWVASIGDITKRKQTEAALRESEKRLKSLSSQLLTAQENEKKRTAQELHDGIGQYLGAIKFSLENTAIQKAESLPQAWIDSLSTTIPLIQDAVEEVGSIRMKLRASNLDELGTIVITTSLNTVKLLLEGLLRQAAKAPLQVSIETLNPIISLIQETIREVRRIGMDLRPSILDDLGIRATIVWLCRELEWIYPGIHIEKQIDIQESDVSDPLKTVIFRVSQEALNNIAKHSKASFVRLSLRKTKSTIELAVEDNGRGFGLAPKSSLVNSKGGFGLVSMKERVENSGGSFAVKSTSKVGTIIRAWWPFGGK